MKDERTIQEHFEHIEYGEGNIQAIYHNNFRLFQYYNSDRQIVKSTELIIVNGVIKNEGQIASDVFNGYHIEDADFKIDELALLQSVNVNELNYGQKKKYKHYKEYVEFKIKYPEWYHIKDRQGFYALEKTKLVQYKRGIYSFYFKDVYSWKNDDGSPNEFYYTKRTIDWKKQRDELLKVNENLQPRLRLLLIYNSLLARAMDKTVELFSVIDKYDGSIPGTSTLFNIKKSELIDRLQIIGNYSQNINHNINTGHYKIALEIQHYCVLIFDDILSVLDDSFFLKIEKTPLKVEFDRVKEQLENAINLEKLDFLLRVGATPIVAKDIDSESSIKYENTIFKKIEGELIFKQFSELYSAERKALGTIYSFLFYSLLNDSFIIDSNTDYRNYCLKSEIKLNNIMSKFNPGSVNYVEHKTLNLKENYEKVKFQILNNGLKD